MQTKLFIIVSDDRGLLEVEGNLSLLHELLAAIGVKRIPKIRKPSHKRGSSSSINQANKEIPNDTSI